MAGVAALEVDGRVVPLLIRRSAVASRISLRLDGRKEAVVLVLPTGVSEGEGLRFATAQRQWIAKRLAAMPPRIPFIAGGVVPVLGEEHVIAARPEARRGVWAEAGVLNVSGRPEHLPRRVRDWLRGRATDEIASRALPMAERVGRRVAAVVVRDQSSRWGSCTADGRLSFSWRLVLAPAPVLTYVVAHEVAHLVEMNHSPAFWQAVRRIMPDMAAPRHWLKLNGAALHRYG